MKKTFTSIICFLLLAAGALGQNYPQSAGFRLGAAGGFAYRRFFDSNIGGEAMLCWQNHGTDLVFLVEKQKPAILFDDLNMNFYYGAGAHIGWADLHDQYYDSYYNEYHYHGYNSLQFGLDGFVAFEYLIPRYPIALSLETKPYFEFFDEHIFGLHVFVIAFGARYTF